MAVAAPLVLCFCASLLMQLGAADYVETAPRPGKPAAPPIAQGECPLQFLQSDILQYTTACSSNETNPGALPSSACCTSAEGLLFQARVRYANATGRLLLPQASADACMQQLSAELASTGGSPLTACGLNTTALSEDTGAACGPSLTTVYDFWSAANHTFPGLTGITCYEGPDCSACLTQVSAAISGLGAGTTALLSTPACQGLAQVAMVAAAYPLLVANSISQCLHGVDIGTVVQQSTCTIFDWEAQNYTAVELSCGAQQVRADRCCDTVIGMYGQVHALYRNRTGHSIQEEDAEACMKAFRAALLRRSIPPSIIDQCHIQGILPAVPVGCYNYTTASQIVPAVYFDQLEAACNPVTCTPCQTAYFSVGAALANTSNPTYLNLCVLMTSSQYLARFNTLAQITDRLNCYFQFPPPLALGLTSPPKGNRKVVIAVSVSVVAAIGLVVLVLVAFILCALRRHTVVHKLDHFGVRQYSFAEIRKGTARFAQSRVLGCGGFGTVYLGKLRGETVAVKVMDRKQDSFKSNLTSADVSSLEEESAELITLARCRHRNLVVLKGCCITREQCILVFEYVEGGSLQDHLYAETKGTKFLDWPTRLKVALGTAKGLTYLHESCTPRVIHRDIKPSNILLTSTLEAKVADFGLAKLLDPNESHSTTCIVGTSGFLDPAYLASRHVTDKTDVYSFGVLLLTLVAGRKPTIIDAKEEEVYLPDWAVALAERGRLEAMVDPRLGASRQEHADCIKSTTRVALLCCHPLVSCRPSMQLVVAMLEKQLEVPALPARPTMVISKQ